MTERYKQQLQLPPLEKYKELLLTELTNQLKKVENIQEFTKEEQEEYKAPTGNLLRIAQGQHSKTKSRPVTKILEEKYSTTVQDIESSFSNFIAETFEQIQKKQEEIKKDYDPVLSKISALENLASAESALGTAIIEVEKLSHLISKGSINTPTQEQSLETILMALQKIKDNLFDTEHRITMGPKIEDAQGQTGSDITTDDVDWSGVEIITPFGIGLVGKSLVFDLPDSNI